MTLAAVLLSGTACAAGGLAVPLLVARVPAAVRPHEPYAVPLAAAAGAVIGASVGAAWPLLYLLPLVPVGVALGLIDARTHLLPTAIIWPTFGGVLALATVSALLDDDPDALVRAGIGSAAVFLVFHALWWIQPAGMGYGDVRLSAVLGFALGYLGWGELMIGIYGAFLVFAVSGFLLALVRRDRQALKASYPFGPFLLVGALAGIAVGAETWSYLVSG
ncbi:A24 family peptidase [Nocardioides sp. SR21]|uniref:prepilin peptidase n=1 Tax=Nocardioides sp. SR21 TaxID=2919501 RepID=UPI001FAACD0A|nr:A24 family peptidase [Nocardioides sp. SR21]